MSNQKRIFISAAEHSADSHCGKLIRALRKSSFSPGSGRNVEFSFVGYGGEEMAQAGCEILESPVSRSAMLYNAFGQVKYFYGLIQRAKALMDEGGIDLLIVCDSPAFNCHIASAAHKRGIPVLFYVAPQLWAWGSWRTGRYRKICDRLACILPFEKDWFSRRGFDTTFVGNPLFDEPDLDLGRSYKTYSDFDVHTAKIALFPGSRSAEISRLFPAMQQIALRLNNRWPKMQFCVSAVDDEKLEMLRDRQIPEFSCEYRVAPVIETARWADLSLVASGSATLQTAAGGCPMVIMYQSSRLLWNLVGQFLVKSRFLSLVNILGRRELVPEFMPYFSSIDPIVDRCFRLLGNRMRLINLSHELVNLVEPLAKYNASQKTAQIVYEMLGLESPWDE